MPKEDNPFSELGKDIFPESSSDSSASLFVVFSYIPFLCLAPILRMGQDEGLKFHARQGLVLFLIEIVAAIFLVPSISSLIWTAVLIACIGSSAAGVVFALQGKKIRLPLIGNLADKIKI